MRLHAGLFRTIQVHRNNRLYRFVLDVCRLIYECQVPSERPGSVRIADFRRDATTMRRLFQQFVRSFYTHHAACYHVDSPHLRWAGLRASKPDLRLLPGMHTDIVLRNDSRYLIIDTKFTERVTEDRFGEDRLRSEHLYQIFDYLKNAVGDCVPEAVECEGMLLYPVLGRTLRCQYELSGTRLHVRGIDLDQEWPQIHRDLLEIVAVA